MQIESVEMRDTVESIFKRMDQVEEGLPGMEDELGDKRTLWDPGDTVETCLRAMVKAVRAFLTLWVNSHYTFKMSFSFVPAKAL